MNAACFDRVEYNPLSGDSDPGINVYRLVRPLPKGTVPYHGMWYRVVGPPCRPWACGTGWVSFPARCHCVTDDGHRVKILC